MVVGLSSGIDSTISAILLKEKGFDVHGLTIIFYEKEESGSKCIKEAAEISKRLEIPHHVLDLRSEFEVLVKNYFTEEYLAGRTPFPCVVCNNNLKWKYLDKKAKEINASHVATGHYVQKITHEDKFYIKAGIDPDKDQSFFLWGLKQDILKKAIFPLGNMYKKDVIDLAKKKDFAFLVEKKESTGACFLENEDYRDFLKKEAKKKGIIIKPGSFIDEEGNKIGIHQGYPFYTIGQRRGLGINTNEALHVKEIVPNNNTVVLSKRSQLFKRTILIEDYYLVDEEDFSPGKRISVKIRYRKQDTPCKVDIISQKHMKIHLLTPLDMIAPGQSAVFYDRGRVLGGGTIVA